MSNLHYGKRLEPRGRRVIHGAGQSADAFAAYDQCLAGLRPLIYMTYAGLKGMKQEYFDGLRAQFDRYDTFLIPQIGLSMTRDGSPEEHYEQDVAAGKYDEQIERFCQGLQQLGRPAYVRIGYEFNGQWNGYVAETFAPAWQRITDALRAHNLQDVATVWCYAPDGNNKDYMTFYPGDAYVDWWSIDLFSPEHFDADDSHAFVRDAAAHGYPVMIGESTPRYVGVQEAEKSWVKWFARYFGFMDAYPQIKAFCYISWDWSKYPMWHNWGDGRIGENDKVLSLYREELAGLRYLHGQGEAAIREALGA